MKLTRDNFAEEFLEHPSLNYIHRSIGIFLIEDLFTEENLQEALEPPRESYVVAISQSYHISHIIYLLVSKTEAARNGFS